MARKPKSTAGIAEQNAMTAGGAITRAELDRARQKPEINQAVAALQPLSTGVLGVVQTLEIRNDTERHIMADLLRQIKTAVGVVDDKFDPITKPLWAAWKAAQTWRHEVKEPLLQAEEIAKEKLGAYELERAAERAAAEQQQRIAAERERMEREQREREYRATIAITTSDGWTHGGAPMAAFAAYGGYVPPQVTTPPSPAPPPAQWEPVNAPTQSPAPLAGVSTRIEWTIEIENDETATRGLIQSGLWDLGGLGAPALFVRCDLSALKMAVRLDGEAGAVVRGALACVPGLKVVERAAVTARGYE